MAETPQQTTSEKRPRSRVARGLASVLALAAAGGLSVFAATGAVGFLETRLGDEARKALSAQGFDWAEIEVDGLQVHLRGTAPNEVQRLRAMVLAEGAVEAGRVIDEMEVAKAVAVKAPDFEVELLRNDDGISIIGLVPAGLDREGLIAKLKQKTQSPKVTDLLETADYEVPASWDAAFDFGLRAAELAKRAKVSIAAGRVTVTAIADSREAKAALEAALKREKPAGIALTTDITAPRPVISPFTLRFVKDEAGARFDACAADTEEARDRILAAATRAGAGGHPGCQLGLGAPSGDWAVAAVAAIDAVNALKGGQVTLSGTDIALQAPAGTPQAGFDETIGRLQAALPRLYSLTATISAGSRNEGPADFSAVSGQNGNVVLRGRITDQRMRDAVESFARSRFGQVDSALRLDPDVPSGWTLRVIAAVEAMAGLQNGTAHVTPDLIRITGTSGDQTASDNAATHLAERLGAGATYELAIRYDRRLDPLLGLPSGEECVDRLNMVMRTSLIGFEPNKAVIAGDAEPTLKELAEAMTDCQDFRIEIGGHTDSQGSEAFNAELSRKRAQAVLAAMGKFGIPTQLMTAKGYGPSQPIADNATEAGREANRRIEFSLLAEAPVEAAPAAVKTVSGVTEDIPDGDVQGPEPEANAADQPPATPDAGATPPGTIGAVVDHSPEGGTDGAGPQSGASQTGASQSGAPDENLREYATMAATLLVTELAQSQHLDDESGPFDTFGAQDAGGEAPDQDGEAAAMPAPDAAAEGEAAHAAEAAAPVAEAAPQGASEPEAPAAEASVADGQNAAAASAGEANGDLGGSVDAAAAPAATTAEAPAGEPASPATASPETTSAEPAPSAAPAPAAEPTPIGTPDATPPADEASAPQAEPETGATAPDLPVDPGALGASPAALLRQDSAATTAFARVVAEGLPLLPALAPVAVAPVVVLRGTNSKLAPGLAPPQDGDSVPVMGLGDSTRRPMPRPKQ